MTRFVISPAAAADLSNTADYLANGGENLALGQRFLNVADETLKLLATLPNLGRERRLRHPDLQSVRSLSLNRPFSHYLLFYTVEPTGGYVLRVLHGARDIHSLLHLEVE